MEDHIDSEPWEALDIDDSDTPFLRPCKRHNQDLPILSQSSSSPSQSQQPKPSPPSPPLIPGPAGAVQAAMHRRARKDWSFAGDEDPIPTQEYIRKVLENGDVCDDDDDFTSNPWLSALDFVQREGNMAISGTPPRSIKKGIHTDKVDWVVALIKSCTPNGLGDLMVTLKDPSGTMGASIHRKVLLDEEFGKIISVGAVLVLKKVAVFAPSRSAYYLNITLNNVVKVMSKDSGPPSKTNYPSSSVRCAAETSERCNASRMPQIMVTQERTEGIMSNLRKRSERRGSVHGNRVLEGNTIPDISCFSNENSRNPTANTEKESSFKKIAVTENTCSDHVIVTDKQPNLWIPAERDNSSHSTQTINATANLVEVSADQETEIASGTKPQTKLPVSRISPPEWTDEQLDELFVFDD
ncbi:uncharacterized protein C17orf53 homolog [Morus notabilis]|uniref:uncharacterized protein C17orf53 homolog n=1 Tax=Morus notabilis TaxID=981085 RepID=UPI000CECFF2E|nr:uncharacterized protein C17orf53 homolog [Morus notabilis]